MSLEAAARVEIISRYRNTATMIKPDGTEVTEADREAERAMREMIQSDYPGHRVLGEEFGESGPEDSEWQWILDPIDGTRWFTLGVPIFGTIIGLLRHGEPVVGVVSFPILGDVYSAGLGNGCWLRSGESDPRRLEVDRTVGTLAEAMVTAPDLRRSEMDPLQDEGTWRLGRLIRSSGKFLFLGDCTQHALVAMGRSHVAVDPRMAPWDIAGCVPLVVEAGGVVCSIDGGTDDICFSGGIVSAASPELLGETMETIANA